MIQPAAVVIAFLVGGGTTALFILFCTCRPILQAPYSARNRVPALKCHFAGILTRSTAHAYSRRAAGLLFRDVTHQLASKVGMTGLQTSRSSRDLREGSLFLTRVLQREVRALGRSMRGNRTAVVAAGRDGAIARTQIGNVQRPRRRRTPTRCVAIAFLKGGCFYRCSGNATKECFRLWIRRPGGTQPRRIPCF